MSHSNEICIRSKGVTAWTRIPLLPGVSPLDQFHDMMFDTTKIGGDFYNIVEMKMPNNGEVFSYLYGKSRSNPNSFALDLS